MMLASGEFDRIRERIYAHAGIFLHEGKVDYVSRRVDSRMQALDLTTVRDYVRYLTFDRSGREMEELINAIVVSETYFFRDHPQLRLLAEAVLPEILKEKGDDGHLSLLSAGCATGEEAYTLAIILREMLEDADAWRLRIDAVDINRHSLQKAQEAIYTDHALRETPHAYRQRYFTREGDVNRLDAGIREMVHFRHANLFDPAQTDGLCAYDIVFCRNVLIYFDRRSAGQVMDTFYEAMNTGAFIFLGSAESVGRATSLFRMVRMEDGFVYRK